VSFFPGLFIFLVSLSLIWIADYVQNKVVEKDKL